MTKAGTLQQLQLKIPGDGASQGTNFTISLGDSLSNGKEYHVQDRYFED